MNIKTESNDGVIYQFEDLFTLEEDQEVQVVIDITYSGNIDEDGNQVLELEWTSVESESNPSLDKEIIRQCNKILECGREETIALFLFNHYRKSEIKFDPLAAGKTARNT